MNGWMHIQSFSIRSLKSQHRTCNNMSIVWGNIFIIVTKKQKLVRKNKTDKSVLENVTKKNERPRTLWGKTALSLCRCRNVSFGWGVCLKLHFVLWCGLVFGVSHNNEVIWFLYHYEGTVRGQMEGDTCIGNKSY